CTEACREQAIELLEGTACQMLVWEDVPGRGENPGLPRSRLRRIIDLSRTPLLVCTEACREQAIELLEGTACQMLVWEDVPGRGENPGLPRSRLRRIIDL
ncbi:hypothetical protein, partial [Escherichia coli]|uniref:hypothetical protein n=1 Tax=Escherichia coli TaxID=562 RepID=UPI00301C3C61